MHGGAPRGRGRSAGFFVCHFGGNTMKSQFRVRLLPLLIGSLLAVSTAYAQQTSSALSGRVVDAAGNPVADVPIGLHGPARPWSGAAVIMVRTATDGSFRLAAPPGEQVVYVAAGEGARWAGADPPMWRPTVRVGETAEHTFRLPLMR